MLNFIERFNLTTFFYRKSHNSFLLAQFNNDVVKIILYIAKKNNQ